MAGDEDFDGMMTNDSKTFRMKSAKRGRGRPRGGGKSLNSEIKMGKKRGPGRPPKAKPKDLSKSSVDLKRETEEEPEEEKEIQGIIEGVKEEIGMVQKSMFEIRKSLDARDPLEEDFDALEDEFLNPFEIPKSEIDIEPKELKFELKKSEESKKEDKEGEEDMDSSTLDGQTGEFEKPGESTIVNNKKLMDLQDADISSTTSTTSSSTSSSRTSSPLTRGRGRPRGRPKKLSSLTESPTIKMEMGEQVPSPRNGNNLRRSGRTRPNSEMNGILDPEDCKIEDEIVKQTSSLKIETEKSMNSNNPIKLKKRWRISSEFENEIESQNQDDNSSDEPLVPIQSFLPKNKDKISNSGNGKNEKFLKSIPHYPVRQQHQQQQNLNYPQSSDMKNLRIRLSPLPPHHKVNNMLNLEDKVEPKEEVEKLIEDKKVLNRSDNKKVSISPDKIEKDEGDENSKDDGIMVLQEVSKKDKEELKERLKSFEQITQNLFRCERKFGKQVPGMECDCTITKADVAKGLKGCGDDCLNKMLMIECSKNCSLGKYCGNRKFQNIENAPVEVFKTAWKGFGLRALNDIDCDQFIMEYVGEVLDQRQFRKRAKQFAKDDVKHFYFMALSSEHCIDASHKGNISRFINHSCDPDAETQKWTVNGELRVGFFSKRKISKGEEITFDYKYERYGQEAQKCFCGSENCRGWLGGEPDKDDDEEEEGEEEEGEDYWSSSSEEGEESLKPISRTLKSKTTPSINNKSQQQLQQQLSPDFEDSSDLNFKPSKSKLMSLPNFVKSRRKKRRSPRKMKNMDDEEDDEIERLKITGIRTRAHTLEICRLVVRTSDYETRMTLLDLLKNSDTPCKRLFLDYRGLTYLNNWMYDLGWTSKDFDLKIAILEVLAILNIPNKTVLKESKVYQRVKSWTTAKCEEDLQILLEEQSRASSPGINANNSTGTNTNSTVSRSTSPKPISATETPDKLKRNDSKKEVSSTPNKVLLTQLLSQIRSGSLSPPPPPPPPPPLPLPPQQHEFDVDMEPPPPGEEIDEFLPFTFKKSQKNIVDQEPMDVSDQTSNSFSAKEETKTSSKISENLVVIKEQNEEMIRSILCELASQAVERSAKTSSSSLEVLDDSISSDVRPIAKPDYDNESEMKLKTVQSKSKELLKDWENLQESFKIPKKERNKLRAEHEREVDQAAAKFHSKPIPTIYSSQQQQFQQQQKFPINSAGGSQFQSSYERTGRGGSGIFPQAPEPAKRSNERRISRFDDKSGLLHRQNSGMQNFHRGHRRQLFSLKAETEESEIKYRSLLLEQHHTKCILLSLDPYTTPMFAEYPEYYFNHDTGNWHEMPPPHPPVEIKRPFPKMANLPLKAFKPDDPPFDDPAYFYPPGVVPVSYMYGGGPEPDEEDPNGLQYSNDVQEQASSLSAHPTSFSAEDFLSSEPSNDEIPFLDARPGMPDHLMLPGFDNEDIPLPDTEQQNKLLSSSSSTLPLNSFGLGSAPRSQQHVIIRLPPKWRAAKDPQGRVYYYNKSTNESSWDPPKSNDENSEIIQGDETDREVIDMETASTDSESPRDLNNEEDGGTGDEGGEEDDEENSKGDEELDNILASDLGAQEKELLLAKKKTKEERHHERKQKRERDREKREYERKRRRERHGKHRKSGLVEEKLIPKRTEKDKVDLMTFKEIRERLANRDLIRERQEIEERQEEERDIQELRAKRQAERVELQQQQQQQQQLLLLQQASSADLNTSATGSDTTTAAADTSSDEVAKKIKDKFKKETSRVIVKVLDPYRRPEAQHGKIQNIEDFKHLAKKLTNYIMTKELKYNKRIEDLKCSESVKNKTADYVRKYMLKFGDFYKKSPQT